MNGTKFTASTFDAILSSAFESKSIKRVTEVETENKLRPGENYVCETLWFKVRGIKGDGTKKIVSFVGKMAPVDLPGTMSFIMEAGLFSKEIKIYEEVIPKMTQVMEEMGESESVWPEPIFCRRYDFILMEDLLVKGYKKINNRDGFDLQHTLMAVRGFARFHGLSLVLKSKNYLDLSNLQHFPFVNENKLTSPYYSQKLKINAQLLRERCDDKWIEIADQLEALADDPVTKLRELCTPSNDFKVLAHGDPWSTNMLFTYSPFSKEPISVKFVDFQFCHFGNYATDLNYLLHTSSQMSVRTVHFEQIMRMYQNTLEEVLQKYDIVPDNLPTVEDVAAEVMRTKVFGVILSTSLLDVMQTRPEDAPCFEDFMSMDDIQLEVNPIMESEHYMTKLQEILYYYLDRPNELVL